jgi:hypothetical protein
MPVIELPEKPSEAEFWECVFKTFSVMLFPLEEDERERRNFNAAAMVMVYCKLQPEGAEKRELAFHEWIRDLWALPLAPQRVWNDGLKRRERAHLAGWIFHYYLRLAHHHPQHCFAERAKALAREVLRPIPSESLLNKTWATFQSVAHFWLAFQTLPDDLEGIDRAEEKTWILRFSLAESYRKDAESRRILKAGATWSIHGGFPLLDVASDITPLPQELSEFLNSQFPR